MVATTNLQHKVSSSVGGMYGLGILDSEAHESRCTGMIEAYLLWNISALKILSTCNIGGGGVITATTPSLPPFLLLPSPSPSPSLPFSFFQPLKTEINVKSKLKQFQF